MNSKPSLWTRVRNFFSPPRESYDTRQARPSGDVHGPPEQHIQSIDTRRHGGSTAIGG